MELVFYIFFVLLLKYGSSDKKNDEIPCGISKVSGTRIANGETAKPHEFPWLVSIQTRDEFEYNHACGGSVIHPRWVITAGHCLIMGYNRPIQIVAGASRVDKTEESQQILKVKRDILLKDNSTGFLSAVGLLYLSEDLNLDGETVAPICLPDFDQKYESDTLTYAGWGKQSYFEAPSTSTLKKITLPIISQDDCRKVYEDSPHALFLSPCQICTNSEEKMGSCDYDNGGPGMAFENGRYLLRGISNWEEGCGNPKYPDVDLEVSCFLDQIHKYIDN